MTRQQAQTFIRAHGLPHATVHRAQPADVVYDRDGQPLWWELDPDGVSCREGFRTLEALVAQVRREAAARRPAQTP